MATIAAALPQNQGLLQDLLHLVSQPLTTLHCTLEHSLTLDLNEDAGERSEEVALALRQTDRVIEAVRLMREYFQAKEGRFLAEPFPLGLAIENVLEQVSVLAEARGLRLFACGTSAAAIPVSAVWLQRALSYLVGLLLEDAPAGWAITVVLEDSASESLISGHTLPPNSSSDRPPALLSKCPPDVNTLRQVKVEIARCVLEASGASLEFYSGGNPGFMIRLPRSTSHLAEIPA
jgi:hypothetical protein